MNQKDSKWLRHHKKITAIVLILSIVSLFFSPLGTIKDRVIDIMPSLVIGLAITEALFVCGLLVMAFVVGFDLGPNPLRWRSHLKTIASQLNKNKYFWVGFWVNTTGAIGSGIVLAFGIIKSLPIGSWGILWLPFVDIVLTFALRSAIIELHKESIK